MENLKECVRSFRLQHEKFLNGCDSIEVTGAWDLENYGEMDAFYSHDLVSIIVRLIASD